MTECRRRKELTYSIIDVFEDFLAEKGVDFKNDGINNENETIIYGSDFDFLVSRIEEILEEDNPKMRRKNLLTS